MIRKIVYGLAGLFVFFVLLVTVVNLWPYTPPADSKKFENVIVFGDSLSDSSPMGADVAIAAAGNNDWVRPRGIDYFIGAPITSNLSSTDKNRYTWVNYLVSRYAVFSAGKDLIIRRKLRESSPNDSNVSYATASAETGDDYINDDAPDPWPVVECKQSFFDSDGKSCVPGLDKQVHIYLQDVDNKPNPDTLHILWAGGNDFYQNAVKLISGSSEPLSQPIDNTLDGVQLLLDSGVSPDNIYVLNLPNFSLVPAVIDLVDSRISNRALRKLALLVVKLVSSAYNLWLKTELVLATHGRLAPGHVFSTEGVLFDIAHDEDGIQQRLGITEPLTLPCTSARKTPVCSGFFFFSDLHPTTAVHEYLAQELNGYIFGD